jgi:drug/metabolite transporter (DMT)-like permease
MHSPTQRQTSLLFVILAAILWSTSGLFVRLLDWPPLAIVAGRGLFASLLFAVYLRRLPRRWTRWQLLAAGGLVLTQLFYVIAVKMTTAANAIFLQFTAPIYVIVLGAWLLHERPTRVDWISTVVIFAGLILFFSDGLNPQGFTGNVLAVISGVTLALMIIAMRAQKHANPAESALLGNLCLGVFGFPFLFQAHWTPLNWTLVAYLGLIQIGLGFCFYSYGIRHVSALEATLVGTLEPILNPLWVFLVLGEKPGPLALTGALVVLAGVVFNAVASPAAET